MSMGQVVSLIVVALGIFLIGTSIGFGTRPEPLPHVAHGKLCWDVNEGRALSMLWIKWDDLDPETAAQAVCFGKCEGWEGFDAR